VSESYAIRSSSIELPNDFTAVQRLKLQSYILQKVVNVHTALAEDFGARGKRLTVSPPMHSQQLETALYAFRQDERDGNLKQA
jgi:hypothetical protein